MNDLHCSPKNYEYGLKDNTCYSLEDLKTIAREYNKINAYQIKITKVTKKQLYDLIKKKLKKICSNERCWLDNPLLKKNTINSLDHLKESFRPAKPIKWESDPKTWLNTYDILFVIKQYEKLHNDFKMLGVDCIDFASRDVNNKCISFNNLCDFDIKSLKNKKRFALVLNLDKHDGPGTHWVSLFCNLNVKKKNYGIYYYDSVANKAPYEVQAFMNLVSYQVLQKDKKNGNKFKNEFNQIQKQFGNSECGMFTIIFLTQMIKNIPFQTICENMHTDENINKLRNAVFYPIGK